MAFRCVAHKQSREERSHWRLQRTTMQEVENAGVALPATVVPHRPGTSARRSRFGTLREVALQLPYARLKQGNRFRSDFSYFCAWPHVPRIKSNDEIPSDARSERSRNAPSRPDPVQRNYHVSGYRARIVMIRVLSTGLVVAVAALLPFLSASGPEAKAPLVDVLTNRYNNWRSGCNTGETLLTAKNVNGQQFGKLFERDVDGDIYAQPLVKNGVKIPNLGARNVVYVATTNNNLYAFDADLPQTGDPYWHVGKDILGDPVPRADVSDLKPPDQYLNFEHNIGVVATPVIDAATNTIYIVAKSRYSGGYRHRLFAFDLATGHERKDLGSPVTIEPTAIGNGVGNVDGKIQMRSRKLVNRAALLLQDGILYVAFGAHSDGEPRFDYHGWIVAYDAHTLRQVAALCTTPDGIQGGIWQSGAGLAAESREGIYPLIYAVVGNGSAIGRNIGQSIIPDVSGRTNERQADIYSF